MAAHAQEPPAPVAGNGGLPKLVVTHESGSRLEVYLWGATITSFVTARGHETLFVSSKAIWDGVKPIRGGIPVVFPQFAAQGPLPQHGFARNNVWVVVSAGNGSAHLSLKETPSTLAVWPHAFRLHLRVYFDAAHLTTSLQVENPGDAPFAFEALLHTYLAVGAGNLDAVRVRGLQGLPFLDKPAGGVTAVQAEAELALVGEVDRVYTAPAADVEVAVGAAGCAAVSVRRHATLRDAAPGLRQSVLHSPLDLVVWNPGADRARAIADLGDEDFRSYVCVEPGRVSTASAGGGGAALPRGKMWTLVQEIAVREED